MGNNNITGPLPTTNWATFPKLVSIDIAHNNINGDLPLDSMKTMSSLRYIKAHHNMLDSVTYNGGGFENLLELKFIYNRNLTSKFPAGFSSIPNLMQLEMHDTNISGGPVPTGPWSSLDFLLISGTGGLCGGALPSPCQDPEVFCDLSQDLPACLGEAIGGDAADAHVDTPVGHRGTERLLAECEGGAWGQCAWLGQLVHGCVCW